MKRITMTAAALVLLGAMLTPAIAEDRPVTKAPPKTMGDEGKLPATDTVTVTAAAPDLNTVQYVKQWFARKLPAVAGLVASILIHPLVGRLIERTGDAAADAMFGRPQDSTHN